MKILHLIYSDKVAGAEKYLRHLLPGVNQRLECRLWIVCPATSLKVFTDFANSFSNTGIVVEVSVAEKSSFLSTAKQISQYCKQHQLNVIHSHLFNADIIAVMIKRLFYKNVILVSTKHGYQEEVLIAYDPVRPAGKKNLYFFITRFLLKYIDHNISISRGISALYKNIGLTNEYFPVIYHGVNVPPSDPIQVDDPSLGETAHRLIIMGRLEKFKGHIYL